MPSALHPQAKFDPIPPDLDLSALVEKTPNFDYVVRIGANHIQELGFEQFEKLVLHHVIYGGKPLVIEGWHKELPPWLFSQTWLEDNVSKKQENVRDIMNGIDIPMTIGHYLGAMEKLRKQWTPTNYRDPKRQRLYLKDIDCPEPWHQALKNVIPHSLFYLNDCIGEQGGPNALHERNLYNQPVLGKGVGPAGDLMSNLPPEVRAENMMCYIGHEGTYTPAHREMCASLGQNIMVETSTAENGEKAGSSIWFMTESKDREVVSEFFLSKLGHDIEVESHFAQINAWKHANFPVYIVNQRAGDFILIPPLAPHQVWNRGTRTMKVAWNRTTVETLELALHEALPRARMVCRDEQYKNKAIIYYSLVRYYDQIKRVEQAEDACWDVQVKDSITNSIRVRQLRRDFKRLFALFTEVLLSELFSKDLPTEKQVEFLPFDSNVTCSYCRCNIFNRFLTCKSCIGEIEGTGDEDTYDICLECYVMGRSCGCVSGLTWVEQWKWSVLVGKYDDWRTMVTANAGANERADARANTRISSDRFVDNAPPQDLDVVRSLYGRKPVAEICQEQLKRRPWKDISKPFEPDLSPESELEPDVDDEGVVRKRKGSKWKSQKAQNKQNKTCHICRKREWSWKLAFCTTCHNAYCYGTLWRAFDLKPQTVMEDPSWQCPECLKICSCGKCRRDATQQAYQPKGTLLGHDTKRVADPRSVESLVDFSRTNLTWLRGEGDDDPQNSLRMQRLVEKAQTEKAREESLDEDNFVDRDTKDREEQNLHNSQNTNSTSDIAIDPQLRDQEFSTVNNIHNSNNSHWDNESTITKLHITHTSAHRSARSDAEHRVVSNDLLAQQGPYQAKASPTPIDRAHSLAVEANMLIPKSPSPDLLAPGRNRMVGMGYYEQVNDNDKILFDHPDAPLPAGQELEITYPRLAEETPSIHINSNKRKIDAEVDNAHAQFYQAQKKQKLADARRNGRYYTTLKQLEGRPECIVKLSLKRSRDFLQSLQDLDEGRGRLRHNPRSPRGNVQRQPRLSESNSDIVTIDIQGRSDQEIYQNDGDDDDDSVLLTPEAVRTSTLQSIQPKAEIHQKINTSAKKHSRPPKVLSGGYEESSNIEDPSHISYGALSPMQKLGENRSALRISLNGSNESQEALPPSLGNTKISHHSRPLENNPISEVLPNGPTGPAQVCRQGITTHGESKKVLLSATESKGGNKDVTTVTNKVRPVIALPDSSKTTPKVSIKRVLSEEYLKAKEEVFRMVEAELQDEDGTTAQVQKATPHKPCVTPPTKVVSTLVKSNLPKSVIQSQPKSLPGNFMSMAERQALKGKPFKVVAAKSTPSRNILTMTSRSRPRSTSSPKLSYSFNVDGPAEDGPSSSDESIPAVRPVIKNPNIEALAGRTGNTKASFTSVSGKLDGARKGQMSVRFFK